MFIKLPMPCHVEGKPLADTASLAHNVQFAIHHATTAIRMKDKAVAFFFHRLLVLSCC